MFTPTGLAVRTSFVLVVVGEANLLAVGRGRREVGVELALAAALAIAFALVLAVALALTFILVLAVSPRSTSRPLRSILKSSATTITFIVHEGRRDKVHVAELGATARLEHGIPQVLALEGDQTQRLATKSKLVAEHHLPRRRATATFSSQVQSPDAGAQDVVQVLEPHLRRRRRKPRAVRVLQLRDGETVPKQANPTTQLLGVVRQRDLLRRAARLEGAVRVQDYVPRVGRNLGGRSNV